MSTAPAYVDIFLLLFEYFDTIWLATVTPEKFSAHGDEQAISNCAISSVSIVENEVRGSQFDPWNFIGNPRFDRFIIFFFSVIFVGVNIIFCFAIGASSVIFCRSSAAYELYTSNKRVTQTPCVHPIIPRDYEGNLVSGKRATTCRSLEENAPQLSVSSLVKLVVLQVENSQLVRVCR